MPRMPRNMLLVTLIALLLGVPNIQPVYAATFSVTNPNDSGTGSLRQAILDANASPGADTIAFNLGNAATWTINLISPLPELSSGGITIDGPLDGSGRPRVALNGQTLSYGGGINLGQGLSISSSGNTVRGLAIYGFDGTGDRTIYGAGIAIVGTAATNNVIENCFLGTNLAGNAPGTNSGVNNSFGGIMIMDGASQNIIRNNIISGNGKGSQRYGLYIGNLDTSKKTQTRLNSVYANKIGVDFAGTAAVPNESAGVYLGDYAFDNVIGPNNIISGNGINAAASVSSSDYGVVVASGTPDLSGNNAIRGNKIGIGANNALLPNAAGGVKVDRSQGVVIGGAGDAEGTSDDRGNIISGNRRSNIFVTQTSGTAGQVALNLRIANNLIGLVSGQAAGGNSEYGITIERPVSAVTIDGNTISANLVRGVEIVGSNLGIPSNITLTNNTIGTNKAGTTALTTRQSTGVSIVGGVTNVTLTNNLISGNQATGVKLDGVSGISLVGNSIGALRLANTPIGNGPTGVDITNSSGVTVGPNNIIAGHLSGTQGDGVSLGANATGNVVKGNTFSANLSGVGLDVSASNNVIGYAGTETGAAGANDGNKFVGNRVGIFINGSQTIRNRLSRNTTSNNIGGDGNHYGIRITNGGNAGIQPPTASGVALSGTTLAGTIDTGAADCSGSGCIVEIFQAVTAEPNEGKFYLSSFAKNTQGSANFSVPGVTSCMPNLTFTVTDRNGNTSAFSPVVPGTNCTGGEPTGGAVPDLSNQNPASRTLGPEIANGPVDVSFTATLKNSGNAAGTFDLTVEAPNGWTNVTVNPSSQALDPNGTQQITFGARVPQNTSAGTYTLRLTAKLGSNGPSDSVDVTVVIPLVPALTFEAANPATKTGVINLPTCFTHRLTNQGNGTDTFRITVTPPTTPSTWSSSVTPGNLVTLDRGVSRDVEVCVTAPQGATGGNYQFTVVATSEANPAVTSPVRTNTVQIQNAAAPQVSPAAVQNADPGAKVTFSHRLTNVGNIGATFTIEAIGVPAGWTVTGLPITTPTIAPNGFVDFSYTVTVADAARAGPMPIRLRVTANQDVPASVDVEDTVNVNQVAKLSLTPATQSSAEAPNSVVTYTLTLRNDGNFADTIRLDVVEVSQSARGWTASVLPSPSVQLQPGESTQVSLVVNIPPGQPVSVSNLTTLRATSSLPAVNVTATATTSIKPVAAALLTPVDPVRAALAGERIDFDFTLLNSGSLDQTFTTEIASTNGTTATKVLTVTSPIALAPGASTPVKLSVVIPANVADGYEAIVVIRSRSSPGNVEVQTRATVRVGPPYDVLVEPDVSGTALPGATVQYTHYVTNTGRLEDSYALTTRSSLGWRTSVAPARVRLLPGESAPVTVTVSVPTSAEANAVDTTVVTARSVADPSISERATSATRVLQVAGIDLSPNLRSPVTPGKTIAFQHTLLNSGNGRDTFTITATQELDWRIQIDYTAPPTKHGRGISLPVQVIVTIPAGAKIDTRNQIVIRATSKFDPNVYAEVVDTVAPLPTQSVGERIQLFLPWVEQ